METETIFALSSGALPSGVAIIRLSGGKSFAAIRALCGALPPPRQAALRRLRDGDGVLLDEGLVLLFPAPASFTGEDCAEMQIHGGRAVVQAVLGELSRHAGLRPAEAGEFSKRAFDNGKLDLVEVEGLSDLIAADTQMQRRLALEQSSGSQSALYQGWAARLIHARAMIEAELDFADEDDVPGSVAAGVWADMEGLSGEICRHLAGAPLATMIRDGVNIVIAGAPNVGKSSLLNRLAERDLAIVTPIAGTTRDVLSVDLFLAGFMIKLHDTAGLRDTQDRIEIEGIRRARAKMEEADIVLHLADHPSTFGPRTEFAPARAVIRVASKIDRHRDLWQEDGADILLSTVTGEGLDLLIEAIAARLPDLSSASAFSLPARQRHVDCLGMVMKRLDLCRSRSEAALEIKAEWLREASDALGRMTGRVDAEDLLEVIFSNFCIGK